MKLGNIYTPQNLGALAQHLGIAPIQPTVGAASAPSLEDGSLLDLVNGQARFRIEGSGPLTQRKIVAATDGAAQLLRDQPAVRQAVSSVLSVIEHAAGGSGASSKVKLTGISFSDSDEGHGANVFAAHADSDPEFASAFNRANASERTKLLNGLAESAFEYAPTTKAMVTSGWMNLGGYITTALLAAHGAPVQGPGVGDAALAIRVLRHESQHIADQTRPELDGEAPNAFHEALAEAHSTRLDQLQAARHAMGLDAAVSDSQLEATISTRPYPEYEGVLAEALRASGVDPLGADASRILGKPARDISAFLVSGIAKHEHTSPARARADLSTAFARANPGAHEHDH